jgi:ketosteroid isomerase-like protein
MLGPAPAQSLLDIYYYKLRNDATNNRHIKEASLSNTSATKSAADTARRFMTLYAAGDVDGMAALCSPDGVLDYVAMGDRGRGRLLEIGVALWRMFVDDFERFRPEIMEIWEDTAKSTAIVSTINRGIQRKAVAGVASRGGELAAPHVFILALGDDGRIAKITAYWDYVTMYRQLGFPPDLIKEAAGAKP